MKKITLLIPFLIVIIFTSHGLGIDADSPRITRTVTIVKEIGPSVVNISTERIVLLKKNPLWGTKGQKLDQLYKNNLAEYEQKKLPSLGSGVIIDQEGLILTNAHVVHRANTIFVTLSKGVRVQGKVIAVNLPHDIAIIKIDPPYSLQVIEFGNSSDLLVGEPIIAIGNAYGLESTVTTGVISAPQRNLYTPQGQLILKNVIQTDAAINPGSSGGALVNMEGKLIGINQVVAEEARGISFAIPINTIKQLLPEFMEYYRKEKIVETTAGMQ